MITALTSSPPEASSHSELIQWQRRDHRVKDDLMSGTLWVIWDESLCCQSIRDVVDTQLIQNQQKRIWL